MTSHCCLRSLDLSLPTGRPLNVYPCHCNGKSRQCMFDMELLRRTGNGYRCLNCAENTEGNNCERCKEGFYRQEPRGRCVSCSCNPKGSFSVQCDNQGRCHCKPGVTGDKCDRCQHNFHSFSESGCRAAGQIQNCDCDPAGSTGQCVSGRCICKAAVEGERCSRCQGYYNLDAGNPEGCSQCFCHGHSTACSSAENYSIHKITSTFEQGDEGWQAQGNGSPLQLQWSSHYKEVYVAARRPDPIYFMAPGMFLGNHQLSYGQELSFDYRVNRPGRHPSQHDVILEGAGLRITAPLMPNGRMLPCKASRTYTFRLDEHPSSNWSPRLSGKEYRQLIGNLTALRIRATYGDSTGYLSNVLLDSAQPTSGTPASWVEQCVCPVGYQGQFCEKCAPGYKREDPAGLGALSNCVLCSCQGGGICDPDTGECYSGDESSATCPTGFYSFPWSPQSCQPCPCQGGQGCSVLPGTQEVICSHCLPGAGGSHCELCTDGYFGDPLGQNGPARPCQPCQCSSADPNASGICNHLTGECKCKDGFFGNPLSINPAEKCRACNCNSASSEPSRCHSDGSCICKPGFEGRSCEHTRCPACYNQVKTQVDQYLQQLQGLEVLVSQVLTGGESRDNGELERKMKEAEEMLQQVLRDAQSLQASDRSLGSRLSKMKVQESTYRTRLEEITETANRLQSLGGRYQSQAENARKLVARARLDLEQSKAKMGSVASICVLKNCLVYYYHLPESPEAEPLPFLGLNSYINLVMWYTPWKKGVKLLSSKLEADAGKAVSDADRVYQSSQMVLDSLAPGQLRKKADSLTGLAGMYIAEYKQLQGNSERWEEEIKELLQKGQNDRLVSVQLLSRANLAKSKAQQALSAGNATFDEVDSILKNLKGFDLQVGNKRKEAEDAMQRLPFISSMVTRASEKTSIAEAALGTAATEAEAALRMAGEAKEIAGDIDQEIGRLAMEANRTADGVLVLEKGIISLRDEARRVESELQRKELEVGMDTTRASQGAQADATDAGSTVQEVLRALEDVLRMMDQPEFVDEQGVIMLETNLSKVRTRNNQLKELMAQLEETARRQKLRIQTLEWSITEILDDIKNLEEIRDSLPPSCYNIPPIEKP
uniref:Laminin subunit gamma 2 n=1 Tax=Podarcis muralis TaxID=64176 RepID=A0A670HMV2_PODMU